MDRLRAVHYEDGLWTFIFNDGARLPTRDQAMADYLATEHGLPRNKRGVRMTDPITFCGDWICC